MQHNVKYMIYHIIYSLCIGCIGSTPKQKSLSQMEPTFVGGRFRAAFALDESVCTGRLRSK